ncbi:aldehyde dehydrogenase [Brevibacillus fluminis]|uniref:3-sulfolactaldehyde dehydrogenase n=1 Tax=Brevibacillus fluminis TaxID=511487 RepID=A0A3M8DBX0_9BACL|nr:aldehyde dehydrogenase family protein [Brevibacillus fluminis]RNB85463.1 aldehyde dehydrogenase [Brevibacillus fluminis]
MHMPYVRNQATLQAKSYINGQWVEGEGEIIEIISPVNGELFGTVRACSIEQVEAAVESAKKAQKRWARMALLDRLDILRRAVQIWKAKGEEMARYITLEMGKTIREAREEVYEMGIPIFEYADGEIQRFKGATLLSTSQRTNSKKIHITHAPIGVMGIITPWNFPVSISCETIPFALVAGNTVVYKPSENTPFSTGLWVEILAEAGLPPGVINLVHGKAQVGSTIVQHKDVRAIAFTGSTAVGERIVKEAGLKRTLLEMGGNGPLIVMEDANIDEAVEAAISGCFYNAGQVCTASERILVHESVQDEFVAKLVERTKKMRLGNPLDEITDMGPLSSAAIVDKMNAHIEDAVAKGAKVVYGGTHEGLYYKPTILINVSQDTLIGREETFGPIAPIIPFSTKEEAVEIANDTQYGLTSAVFTSGLETAWYMSEHLEHGMVHINEGTNYWELLAPFGGVKNSGNGGRVLGSYVLEDVTEVKLIIFEPTKVKRNNQ